MALHYSLVKNADVRLDRFYNENLHQETMNTSWNSFDLLFLQETNVKMSNIFFNLNCIYLHEISQIKLSQITV